MKVFVGTSGWWYDWNKDKSLEWYAKNSSLNAVELNASFYRFPYPNMVKSWAVKGKNLRWAVKVNRLITHIYKFNEKALSSWKKFKKLFEPLDSAVDFYLFQLPPGMKPASYKKIKPFIKKTKLNERFALEFRNNEWFDKKWVKLFNELGITLVSVDCPDFPRMILSKKIVYERVHGRTSWYSHNYSDNELREIKESILKVKPKKVMFSLTIIMTCLKMQEKC